MDGEVFVRILLTNDDGFYAPGLAALEVALRDLGEIYIVAPATEQSGVSHSITFLSPLVCKEIFEGKGKKRRGWAVEGSPADCVKLGVFEFCPERPDLVVSGINGGLNAGINVLYSGTVAAAIEGSFFGITSIAVSLEYDEQANFERAAEYARDLIAQILHHKTAESQLFNVNIPTKAIEQPKGVKSVPMGVNRYGEHFLKRKDPKGRTYYWATSDPPPEPSDMETDLSALADGWITVTPLHYDMTKWRTLERMHNWDLQLRVQ
jgi:5'-nucleotidase